VGSDDSTDVDEVPRGLVLDDEGDVLVGSYADSDHSFRFRSEVSDEGFELEVTFNGMTLLAEQDASGIESNSQHRCEA